MFSIRSTSLKFPVFILIFNVLISNAVNCKFIRLPINEILMDVRHFRPVGSNNLKINPFPFSEEQEQSGHDYDNYHPHKDIAVFPVEFRHEFKIHPWKSKIFWYTQIAIPVITPLHIIYQTRNYAATCPGFITSRFPTCQKIKMPVFQWINLWNLGTKF